MIDWIEPHGGEPQATLRSCMASPSLASTGARGAGKSRLLLEVERLDPPETVHLSPSQLPRSHDWRSLATSKVSLKHWHSVWRVAILTSAMTHVLAEVEPIHADVQVADKWLADQEWLKFTDRRPAKHPFSVLKQAALHLESRDETEKKRWVEQDSWSALEAILDKVMRHAPPLVIVFDEFDKYPIEDPSLSAEVQAGLAMFMADYLRRPHSGLTIRAAIDARALRFAERHNNHVLMASEAIHELIWTKDALREMIDRTLIDGYGARPSGIQWLVEGDRIPIPERRTTEDPTEYLLRHSALSAGDLDYQLTMLGRQRVISGGPFSSEAFRAAVADNSVHLARTRLRHAAEELAAFAVNSVEVRDFANVDRQVYSDAILTRLEAMREEVFGRIRFHRHFRATWDPATRTYVLNILWANGLVTLSPKLGPCRLLPKAIFNEVKPNDLRLAFNPILHDLVPMHLASEEIRFDYR